MRHLSLKSIDFCVYPIFSLNSTGFGVYPKSFKIWGKAQLKKKKPQNIKIAALKMVGVAELESATPCVSCKCSNQLSYTPAVLF